MPQDPAPQQGRPGDQLRERYVTDTTAALAASDTRFTIELAKALLRAASEKDGAPARRAETMLRHLPRSRLTLGSEHHVSQDRLRDILRDRYRSRIDWVFLGDSFALAVEVKTRSRTAFSPRQLDNYHRVLKTIGKPHSGLLAITTRPPGKRELLARRRHFFLGAILWNDAKDPLRRISPTDPTDAGRWKEMLDGILRVEPSAGRR